MERSPAINCVSGKEFCVNMWRDGVPVVHEPDDDSPLQSVTRVEVSSLKSTSCTMRCLPYFMFIFHTNNLMLINKLRFSFIVGLQAFVLVIDHVQYLLSGCPPFPGNLHYNIIFTGMINNMFN